MGPWFGRTLWSYCRSTVDCLQLFGTEWCTVVLFHILRHFLHMHIFLHSFAAVPRRLLHEDTWRSVQTGTPKGSWTWHVDRCLWWSMRPSDPWRKEISCQTLQDWKVELQQHLRDLEKVWLQFELRVATDGFFADLTRRYSNESLAKSPETFSTSLHFEMFFHIFVQVFGWVVDEFSHRSHHRWKCRTPCSSSVEVGIRQTKQGIEGLFRWF